MNNFNKKFIYFICMVSAMGGLLFGYDWVVIGGAKPFYELYFDIADSPLMQGVAMTTALVGCLIGAMMAGALADKYGRKPLLIIAAVFFTVSAIATGLFNDFTMFNVARFIGGIGIGVASALSPMYIAEISPTAIRGKLVSLNQMTIVLGILGAQICNWLIADAVPAEFTSEEILASWNGQMGWRWMFWAETVPAALFLLLAFFIPESPRWQIMKGLKAEAQKTLANIGGAQYAEMEVAAVAQSSQREAASETAGLKTLFTRKYAAVLTLGIVIAVFQQWCGTNVIFNYAQEIFSAAGYAVADLIIYTTKG